jgi:hypothetical protein
LGTCVTSVTQFTGFFLLTPYHSYTNSDPKKDRIV